MSSHPCSHPVSTGGRNKSLYGCGSRYLCSAPGMGIEGLLALPGHRLATGPTAAPANVLSSTPRATRTRHLASPSSCRCWWPPWSPQHSSEQSGFTHPLPGDSSCSEGL